MVTTFKNAVVNNDRIIAILSTPKGVINIYKSVHSGKVTTRSKLDTLTGVLHPGVIIGQDEQGRLWIAHNHYKNKRPAFDVLEKYLDNEQMLWDNRAVKFTREEIVERAIAEVRKGKEYKAISYNCQIFVNIIVRNENASESVDKLTNGAIGFGIFLSLIGIFAKNKGLMIAGMAIAGGSSAVKIYSKLK